MLNFKLGKDPIREDAIRLISDGDKIFPRGGKHCLRPFVRCRRRLVWPKGRLASTLEEVGVPIQTGMKITDTYEGGVVTSKGLKIEADEVRMCDGQP